ncbi:Transposon Tf2-9 polyprotein [Araneus ventricosus]|uniref:RNA-directed DNA polymerase n=1 Tax=Araneus ventricosus TaxID=182803 RepID=A0A4Y2ANQ1_ARAVE|nr:Transposon Tf2-9 polyprotein [Araneus ventricosus]
MILQPQESSIVKLCLKDTRENISEIFFQPTISSHDIEIHPALHTVKNPCFPTVMRNLGNTAIHFNKGQVFGEATPSFLLKTNENANDKNICGSPNNNTPMCNLITPSEDILKKRKDELSETDFKLEHLNSDQKQLLLETLLDRSAAFSKSLKTIGCTDRVIPTFNFRSHNPIKTLPFEIPHAIQGTIKEELNELIEAGLIHRNISQWSSPMVLVKKKQNPTNPHKPASYRMALDLRLLNTILENSTYPLPKIPTLINEISKYPFYTTIDFCKAYWQILLPEEMQDVLTFTTPFRTFANRRLVFGLKTAASVFQALVDLLIDELKLSGTTGIYAYQDDIVIGAHSFQEMHNKIRSVLDILIKYNLTLSPEKCVFFKSTIDYLGFNISHNKIQPTTSNILKITSFQPPRTVKQVRRFLGLCGFYRSLIPGFAELIECLTELTRKNVPFQWTPTHQEAFKKLQDVFFTKPFVRLPDWDKPFVLNTDASGQAISGILLQEHEGKLHPISYYSKTLSNSERNYPAIKLELFAIYKSVHAFKTYLYNTNFKILTDSKPLLHYKKIASPTDIVSRWLLYLSEFQFTCEHIPGKENTLADFFSRFPVNRTEISNTPQDEQELILPVVETHCNTINVTSDTSLEISTSTWLKEQADETQTNEIIQLLKNPSLKDSNNIRGFYIDPTTHILMFKSHRKSQAELIVVPKSLQHKALDICHISHTGLDKTYQIVSNRYYWKGVYIDTKNFVLSCEQCIKNKSFTPKHAPPQSNRIPTRPGDYISVDIKGPLPNSSYVLTVLDHFSKHIVLYSLKNITAETVSKHILNYISIHGRPSQILSDRGLQFTSEVFSLINKTLGIKLSHTSPFHPQTNGQTERLNLAIESSILTLQERGVNLQNSLLIHQNIYNGLIHPSTGYTPNLLHFGRNLPLIFDTFDNNSEPIFLDKAHYVQDLLQQLNTAYELAYSTLTRKQVEQNNRLAKNSRPRALHVGDIVYLKSKGAFKTRFEGPYTIIAKRGEVNYTIQALDNKSARSFTVHVDRLRYAPSRKSHLISHDTASNESKTRYFLRSSTHQI